MMNIDKCAVQLLDNYLAGMKIKPVVRYHYPPPGTTKWGECNSLSNQNKKKTRL